LQEGLLDRLPIEGVERLRAELPAWLDRSARMPVETLQQTGRLDDARRAELRTALSALVQRVIPTPVAPKPEIK
jgi:F0F1-type ATP synthase alpha subunit